METIREIVPVSKPTPYSKRWWSKELTQMRRKVRKAGRDAYPVRQHRDHPIHELYQRLCNDYSEMIRKAKRSHWEKWLEEMDEHSIWTADKLVLGPSTDGGRACIPDLQTKGRYGNKTTLSDNAEKSKLLYQAFFPSLDLGNTTTPGPDCHPQHSSSKKSRTCRYTEQL